MRVTCREGEKQRCVSEAASAKALSLAFFGMGRKVVLLVRGKRRPREEGERMESRSHCGKQVVPSRGVSWKP